MTSDFTSSPRPDSNEPYPPTEKVDIGKLMTSQNTGNRKALRDVIIFFVIAFVLTYLANQLPGLKIGPFSFNLILCGFGPLVSGLVCYRILKTKNALGISPLGTRPLFSIAICIVPLISLCLTQSKLDLSAILVYGLTHLVYCFGEEYGWRHYLQNATCFMNEWVQSFVIGALWFTWHYSFVDDLPGQLLGSEMPAWIFPIIMIVLLSLQSYLFGLMVLRSKSVLFPTVGHLLFKTGPTTMIITGVLMLVLLIYWDKIPIHKSEYFA